MLKALYQSRTNDNEGALKSVTRAEERRGESVDPLVLKGVILHDLGRIEDAKLCFAKVLELEPDNQTAKNAFASVNTELTGDSR